MRILSKPELRRAKPDRDGFAALARNPITVVLDGVSGFYNIGAMFRLCDAFLVERLIICGEPTKALLRKRKLVQAAMGTQHWVPWQEEPAAAAVVCAAKTAGHWIATVLRPPLHNSGCTSVDVMVEIGAIPPCVPPHGRNGAMLKVQFDGEVLTVRPEGPITRAGVATLTRTVDEYLADHPKIAGVMVETRTFPGYTSVGAFADYARFIAGHRARIRRIALVTDSALAPISKFIANYVVGVEMRHYPFAEGTAAQAWLRSP